MKTKMIFFGMFIILSMSVIAQNLPSFPHVKVIQGNPDRYVTDIVCPLNSLYGQTPQDYYAWAVDNDLIMYDNIITAPASPVTSITWWMLEDVDIDPLTVDLIFRQNSGGVPGDIIAAFNGVQVSKVNTGELLYIYPIWSYTFYFPPVTLADGDWVGIDDYPNSFEFWHHYWLTSATGDNAFYIMPPEYGFITGYGDLAFCLGIAPPEALPVANWALILGGVLIAVLIGLRTVYLRRA